MNGRTFHLDSYEDIDFALTWSHGYAMDIEIQQQSFQPQLTLVLLTYSKEKPRFVFKENKYYEEDLYLTIEELLPYLIEKEQLNLLYFVGRIR